MKFSVIEVTIAGIRLKVNANGSIERCMKSGNWKLIENTANHRLGYNVIMIDGTQYTRSRIVGFTFLGIRTLTDKSVVMHHKDNNRLNCSVDNLSVESYSTINYYRKDTNGYYQDPQTKKYIAMITSNGTTTRLGKFSTAEEAHARYIEERDKLIG
jgi:hypothetical protein